MTERVATDANGRKYITTEPFKPDWDTQAVLVEEMQRMAKRIEALEAAQECVGWFGYDTGLRLWFEANKGDDGAIPLYKDQQHRPWVGAAQPAQEAIYGMNQDDWKDVVAAIAKVRDGRGIYLACRPADVLQDWFLALGTAKVKEVLK
jgi:hypothetical protein